MVRIRTLLIVAALALGLLLWARSGAALAVTTDSTTASIYAYDAAGAEVELFDSAGE